MSRPEPSPLTEKKYLVTLFVPAITALKKLGVAPTVEVSSKHYYARLGTDDTIKMVAEPGKTEIHILRTRHGLHALEEIVALQNVEDGFAWFKQHGYDTLDVLTMHKVEYDYNEGGLALYTINGHILSVVVGFYEVNIGSMEQLFGLESAEQLRIPFNKYVEQVGAIQTITI